MSIRKWSELKFWKSGEWQVIREKLDDYRTQDCRINPERSRLFNALRAVRFHDTRACVLGQDPYPTHNCATGLAFSVPETLEQSSFPPTLRNIFNEYAHDLGYPWPSSGDLTPWSRQGVLLWNCYPVCLEGKPGSCHWNEWEYLTNEVISELDARGTVFVALGSVARRFCNSINNPDSSVIVTSHPSPLGANKGFLGSSIFSRINEALVSRSLPPINWRLP